LILTGPSQAGKSALINAVLGKAVAKEGNGTPTTMTPTLYDFPEKRLTLVDTRGYEYDHVNSQVLKNLPNPHLIWLVLNAQASTQKGDFDVISKFPKVPTIVVINKADVLREGTDEDAKKFDSNEELPPFLMEDSTLMAFRKLIPEWKQRYPQIKKVLGTSLKDSRKRPSAIGVTNVLEATMCCLDDGLRLLFLENVEIQAEKKRNLSIAVISAHVAMASGAAWTPVPAVDSLLITGLQITMVLALFKIWGVVGTNQRDYALVFLKACVPAFVSFGIGYGIAQLLKFIPVYGTIAGGALSMTVASLATIIVGVAVVLYLKERTIVLANSVQDFEKDVKEFVKQNKGRLLNYSSI